MHVLSTGDVLGERYRLDQPVAGGGMGEVWRATDLALSRTVAVKVLRPALLADPTFEARFRAEARTMAALNHPHVANVYDYGRDGVAYLVMAYVDGEALSDRIAARGRLGPAETMGIVAQAADALDAAHRLGIVHRDVKPGNLLISPDGTVTLVDFGVARSAVQSTALTTGRTVLGTALYMAPEQASAGEVGPAADVYALGAVAYHALAGQPPFPGENVVEIAYRHVYEQAPPLPADVPPAVRQVVERAMAKDPADRYPGAADLAAAARIAAAQPYQAPAPTAPLPAPVPPPVRPPARRVGGRGLMTTGILVLLLCAIGLFALANAARTPARAPVAPPASSAVPVRSPSTAPPGPTRTRTAPTTSAPAAPVPSPSSAAPSPVPSASPSPAGTPSPTVAPSVSPAVAPTSPGSGALSGN